MLRVSEFVFYELAVKIHKLTELPDELKYSGIWYEWHQARLALDEIYKQRPLNFATPVAWRLYQAINAIVPETLNDMIGKLPAPAQQGQEATEEEDIPVWQINEVRDAAKEFETVLRSRAMPNLLPPSRQDRNFGRRSR
jgi:hypothetical protein